LRIEVDTSVGGRRVAAILNEIGATRGWPDNIVVDNGPEFTAKAIRKWLNQPAVKTLKELKQSER
jgi:putative transposase